MSRIFEEFKNITKDVDLYPPLNNYSFFGQCSGFVSHRFFGPYYDADVRFDLILAMKDGDSIMLISEPKFIATSKEIFSKYLHNQSILSERLKLLEKNKKGVDKIYYKYVSGKQNESIRSLLRKSKKMYELMWHLNAALFFAILFDKELCLEVMNNSGGFISQEELDEIWDKAIVPSGISFDQKQKLEYLTLLKEGKTQEEISQRMAYIVADYFGVKDRSEVVPLLVEKFGKIIDPQSEIEKINEGQRKRETEFNEWRSELNEKQKIVVDYMQAVINIRDERKAIFSKGYVVWWDLMKKMFRQAGISYKLLPYVGFQELMNGVEYLKAHKDDIEGRLNGAIMINRYDWTWEVEKIDYDTVKEEMITYYNSKIEKLESEFINGKVGSPGKAIGTVRVVLNANQYNEFNEGDILVTGMTRPEYVPLMKKAAAVVTDEGGITCHAAIVSRELGIPAVISTKNATKILKDGMEVEVNADEGVVKIIK